MTQFKLFAALALLGSVFGTPALAETISRDSASQTYASAELGTQSTRSHVWPAPIGHRQPRPADIPAVSHLDQLDDLMVDRRITICRGC